MKDDRWEDLTGSCPLESFSTVPRVSFRMVERL